MARLNPTPAKEGTVDEQVFPWNDCITAINQDNNPALAMVFALNAIFDLLDARLPKEN